MRRSACVALLLVVASAVPAAAQTQRDLQERYCTGDAFRLCGAEIPDEARIVACMARQRRLLSPPCLAVFDDSDPASAARAKPSKPMQLRQN